MENVDDWIVNKVKFTSDPKKAHEISKLLCKSRQMAKIAEFLAKRVLLKPDVAVVKGNIRLVKESDFQTEDIDQYDASVVSKALVKAKLQKGQLEHEIARLQKLNSEIDLSFNSTRNKVFASTAQSNQLVSHHDKFSDVLKDLESKAELIEALVKARTCHQEQDIQEICARVKPHLYGILNQTGYINLGSIQLLDHPDKIINGLLNETRSVLVKAQAERDKNVKLVQETKLNEILEEMWVQHVNSYKAGLHAEGECSEFDKESARVFEESLSTVKDDQVKRLILLKKTKRSGQAMIKFLTAEISLLRVEDKQELLVKKEIIDRYALVEKQSKEMLGTKLMIEELLAHTSGQQERVSHFVQAIKLHKEQLKHDFISDCAEQLEHLVQAAIQQVHSHNLNSLSLDRIGKDSRCGKFVTVQFKPNFCHLMKTVLDAKIHRMLVTTYSVEMEDMHKFGSTLAPHEILEQLLKAFGEEKKGLKELIERKLKSHDPNAALLCCSNLLKSLQTFQNEPGKEAFCKNIQSVKHQGKTLVEWYNLMKTAH